MGPEAVLTLGRTALEVTIVIIALLLMPALIVGLLVSMFQAATQINEATLSFIPKLFITFIVMLIGGPWILQVMTTYTKRLIENIPMMIG
ncbi:Flagellar biosynthesis protein FliQ [hydrothermal vent metagenome]|uniref:Flagellar biosynthetic protein FliQ n=1 Tax=hydrothermal vent metagenome TaxID=652676 RepID=A0A3B1A268_9ZZZZ